MTARLSSRVYTLMLVRHSAEARVVTLPYFVSFGCLVCTCSR